MARKVLRRAWTLEDTVVVKLLQEGKDYHQIARKLKRSTETVRLYAQRLPQLERRPGERG